jgi:hypothetical protein
MRGKLLFITGGLIGYVLGARAGRKRYDQIAAAATELWNAKPVQRRVTEVRDFALEAVGDVPSQLFEASKKAGKKVYTAVQDKSERSKAGRSSATTSAARAAAAEKVAEANEPAAQATAQATAKARAKQRAPKAGTTTPTSPAPTSPAPTAPDSAEPTAN